jgi:hypothetical protein
MRVLRIRKARLPGIVRKRLLLGEKMPKYRIFPQAAISLSESSVAISSILLGCIGSKIASGTSEKAKDRFIIRLYTLEILTKLDFRGHTITEACLASCEET